MKLNNSHCFTQLPDCILFDTDNTLYEYDIVHIEAQKAVKDKVTKTLSISENDFDSAFSKARTEIKAMLKNTAASHSRLLYFQRVLEILGLGSQVLLALDFEQTYWRTFLSKIVLFDGVRELLDEIRLLGIPTAIVTDLTAQIQFRKMVYLGLDRYFDVIVTSEEAGFDKPAKEPFELALQKVKVECNHIWMIGDNPINDIKGAKEQINAVTLQKIHKGVKIGEGDCLPDAVFNSYSELHKLVLKISADNTDVVS